MDFSAYVRNVDVEAAAVADDGVVFIGTAAPSTKVAYAWSCPDHYLICFPITPRPAGSEAMLVNGRVSVASHSGNLWLIPPGFVQNGCVPPQRGRRQDIYCAFPRQRFEALMGGQPSWSREEMAAALDLRDDSIHATIRRLGLEVRRPGANSRLLVNALTAVMAVDVRRFFASVAANDLPDAYSLRQHHLNAIRDHVAAHLADGVSVEGLAELVGLSARHLTRSFRLRTGETISGYVSRARFDRAKLLLSDGNMPIKAIAAAVGFGSVQSFTAAFGREIGVTPHVFRISQRTA